MPYCFMIIDCRFDDLNFIILYFSMGLRNCLLVHYVFNFLKLHDFDDSD